MYKISLIGTGAEITQGFLPIDTIESIYEDMDIDDISLEDYLLESLSDPNKLDWYEVDDNFHETGPYLEKTLIQIEQENCDAIIIDTKECDIELEVIEELTPTTSLTSDLAVLTCIDESYGVFFTSTIKETFNPSLLKLKVKSLNTHSIIYNIEYNSQALINESSEPTLSKNFIASIEN